MTIIPSVSPPLPTRNRWVRPLTSADPFKWLSLGYRDFKVQPAMSVIYAVIIFAISLLNSSNSNQPANASGQYAEPSIIQSQTGTGV